MKIGIIGAGNIVENQHLPVLKNIKNVSIAWIYDSNPKRVDLLSKMYKIPALNTNIEEAIQLIDVCLLAIPLGARKKYIDLCAQFNKALYCEKPFATSLEEHQELVSLFPDYALAVGFQRRCYANVRLLKDVMSTGMFGTLASIDIKQGAFSLKSGGKSSFVSDAKLSGGGVLIESAIHLLDQVLFALGSEDVQVKALKSLAQQGIDYDSEVSAVLTLPGKKKIPLEISVSTIRSYVNGMQFIFEKCTVFCPLEASAGLKILLPTGQVLDLVNTIPGALTVNAAFEEFWIDFLAALKLCTPNYTSAYNSVLTSKLIGEIYKRINA